MKNMKIAITDEVHLKAVCDVLESMGHKCDGYHPHQCNWIYCVDDGTFAMYTIGFYGDYPLITLTDLLRMRDEQFKDSLK